jgi:hypothetical protein
MIRLERDLLQREKAALERELQREPSAEQPSAVIVIPGSLVDELLEVALPVQANVDGRFRITADSARVDFRGALALVRLAARVEWLDRDNVSADIDVVGSLQVLEIDTVSGTLVSRVEILGFETRNVQLGALSPPAGRLLDEFAERPASELNALLSRIEIPVRLFPSIPLPTVAEDEISIAGMQIPLETRVQEVRVGAGRLWVYVQIGMTPPAP